MLLIGDHFKFKNLLYEKYSAINHSFDNKDELPIGAKLSKIRKAK